MSQEIERQEDKSICKSLVVAGDSFYSTLNNTNSVLKDSDLSAHQALGHDSDCGTGSQEIFESNPDAILSRIGNEVREREPGCGRNTDNAGKLTCREGDDDVKEEKHDESNVIDEKHKESIHADSVSSCRQKRNKALNFNDNKDESSRMDNGGDDAVNNDFDTEDAEADNDDDSAYAELESNDPTPPDYDGSRVAAHDARASVGSTESNGQANATGVRASSSSGRVRVGGRPPLPQRPLVMDAGLADDFVDGDDEEAFFFAPDPVIAETAPDMTPEELLRQATDVGLESLLDPVRTVEVNSQQQDAPIPSAPPLNTSQGNAAGAETPPVGPGTPPIMQGAPPVAPGAPIPVHLHPRLNRNDARSQYMHGANNAESTPVHPTLLHDDELSPAYGGAEGQQLGRPVELVILGQGISMTEITNSDMNMEIDLDEDESLLNSDMLTRHAYGPGRIESNGSISRQQLAMDQGANNGVSPVGTDASCGVTPHQASNRNGSPSGTADVSNAANQRDTARIVVIPPVAKVLRNRDESFVIEDSSTPSTEDGTPNSQDNSSRVKTPDDMEGQEESTDADARRIMSAENDFLSIEVRRNSSSPVIGQRERTDQDADALLNQIITGRTERGMGPNAAFADMEVRSEETANHTTCRLCPNARGNEDVDGDENDDEVNYHNTGGKKKCRIGARYASTSAASPMEGSVSDDCTELATRDETSHGIPEIHSTSASHGSSQGALADSLLDSSARSCSPYDEDHHAISDQIELHAGPQHALDEHCDGYGDICTSAHNADAEDADKSEELQTSFDARAFEPRDVVADTNANLMVNQSSVSHTALLYTLTEESNPAEGGGQKPSVDMTNVGLYKNPDREITADIPEKDNLGGCKVKENEALVIAAQPVKEIPTPTVVVNKEIEKVTKTKDDNVLKDAQPCHKSISSEEQAGIETNDTHPESGKHIDAELDIRHLNETMDESRPTRDATSCLLNDTHSNACPADELCGASGWLQDGVGSIVDPIETIIGSALSKIGPGTVVDPFVMKESSASSKLGLDCNSGVTHTDHVRSGIFNESGVDVSVPRLNLSTGSEGGKSPRDSEEPAASPPRSVRDDKRRGICPIAARSTTADGSSGVDACDGNECAEPCQAEKVCSAESGSSKIRNDIGAVDANCEETRQSNSGDAKTLCKEVKESEVNQTDTKKAYENKSCDENMPCTRESGENKTSHQDMKETERNDTCSGDMEEVGGKETNRSCMTKAGDQEARNIGAEKGEENNVSSAGLKKGENINADSADIDSNSAEIRNQNIGSVEGVVCMPTSGIEVSLDSENDTHRRIMSTELDKLDATVSLSLSAHKDDSTVLNDNVQNMAMQDCSDNKSFEEHQEHSPDGVRQLETSGGKVCDVQGVHTSDTDSLWSLVQDKSLDDHIDDEYRSAKDCLQIDHTPGKDNIDVNGTCMDDKLAVELDKENMLHSQDNDSAIGRSIMSKSIQSTGKTKRGSLDTREGAVNTHDNSFSTETLEKSLTESDDIGFQNGLSNCSHSNERGAIESNCLITHTSSSHIAKCEDNIAIHSGSDVIQEHVHHNSAKKTSTDQIPAEKAPQSHSPTEQVILEATDLWLKKITDFCKSPTVLSDSRSDAKIHKFTAECKSHILSISKSKLGASVNGNETGITDDDTRGSSCELGLKESPKQRSTEHVKPSPTGRPVVGPTPSTGSRHRVVRPTTCMPVSGTDERPGTSIQPTGYHQQSLPFDPAPPAREHSQLTGGERVSPAECMVRPPNIAAQGSGDVGRPNSLRAPAAMAKAHGDSADGALSQACNERDCEPETDRESLVTSPSITARVSKNRLRRRLRSECKHPTAEHATREACELSPQPHKTEAQPQNLPIRKMATSDEDKAKHAEKANLIGDNAKEIDDSKQTKEVWPWQKPYPRKPGRLREAIQALGINSSKTATPVRYSTSPGTSTLPRHTSLHGNKTVSTDSGKNARSVSNDPTVTPDKACPPVPPTTNREKMAAPTLHRRYRPQKVMTVKEFEKEQVIRHLNLDFRRINKTGPSVDCHMDPYVMGRTKASTERQRAKNNYNSLLALENCKFLHVLRYTKSVYHGNHAQGFPHQAQHGSKLGSSGSQINGQPDHHNGRRVTGCSGTRAAWTDQQGQWAGSLKARTMVRPDNGLRTKARLRPSQGPSWASKV